MTKRLTGKTSSRIYPPLRHKNSIATRPEEKAEMFSTLLEEQFSNNPAGLDQDFTASVESSGKQDLINGNQEVISPITFQEIQNLINMLRNRKAPGREGVTNLALKNLPKTLIQEITQIGNAILQLEHYPTVWKTANTILLPKPGKPRNQAASYRPISLLPAISKLIERTIQSRLKEHTDIHNILPNQQHGFRNEHSTNLQLLRLTDDITYNFNLSRPTGAVFLDIEKAFDRVWHSGLIYKLKKFNYPQKLINLIRSYLFNRKYAVTVESVTSTERTARAGVPQGSVLGPLLFNIYIADVPTAPYTKLAQFADDTAIYISSHNKAQVTLRLQAHLDLLNNYFLLWRIKINPQKTMAVHFDMKRRRCKPKEVSLQGHTLPWNNNTKYLGVTLDAELLYHSHILTNIKKAKQLFGCLYPLLNRKSKLSLTNKLHILKVIIYPAVTYGAEVWGLHPSTQKLKLQSALNKIVRITANAPWYISNLQLREELQIPTIEEQATTIAKQITEKMKTHPNAGIREILEKKALQHEKRTTTAAWKRKQDNDSGNCNAYPPGSATKKRKL